MSFSLIFSEVVGNFSSEREEVSLPHPYVEFKVGGRKTQTKVRALCLSENRNVALTRRKSHLMFSLPTCRVIFIRVCDVTFLHTRPGQKALTVQAMLDDLILHVASYSLIRSLKRIRDKI